MSADQNSSKSSQEPVTHYHRALLDTLDSGVIMLDAGDVLVNENESALKLWGLAGAKLAGKHVQETPLVVRCPELTSRLEESRRVASETPITFQCVVNPNNDEKQMLQITIRPVIAEDGARVGTLIYAQDISHRDKLQTTIEQLEATNEELQSANEELETTNEELQSTNEELETTNEELQSTNEELETTNEELQSLNEELENMNEELEFRTRELDNLNSRYAETLARMPWAVAVLDNQGKVQFWNSAAERLFNLQSSSVIGLQLAQLPIEHVLRQSLLRRTNAVLGKKKPLVLHAQQLTIGRSSINVDIHFTPLGREGSSLSMLLMFSPAPTSLRPDGASLGMQLRAKRKKTSKKSAGAKDKKKSRR